MLAVAAAAASIQLCDHEGEQPIHLKPPCVQTTILFFTFSTVFNYMRCAALYYKMGFVLESFARL